MASELKVATFNVEWMVSLFKKGKPQLLKQHSEAVEGLGAKPKDPQGVANRIAAVIGEVDADILGICEGPRLQAQMQTFVDEKLAGQYSVYSMSDGPQSVHILVHKRLDRRVSVSPLPKTDKVFERLRTARTFHKFGNVRVPHEARFTRLPVVLRLAYKGETTEIMAVHTKSKFSELKSPRDWEKKVASKIISAITSRQKLSIEMNVIRKYIAHRLHSQAAHSVIVMGDLNDGTSRDTLDDTYLLHNIVHELRGAFHHDVALMRHVLTSRQLQKKSYAWTVEFRDATRRGRNTRVLLDHMVFSPNCYQGGKISFVPGSGTIEHAAYLKHVTNKGKSRDERPSDHVPLSARFQLA